MSAKNSLADVSNIIDTFIAHCFMYDACGVLEELQSNTGIY